MVQPSTAYDAKGLLHAAIEDNNPVMFYEHKLSYKTKGTVPAGKYVIPLGVADIKRLGTHVTVVATGIMVEKSLAAAEQLAAEGISLEVIDPRTLVPLDTKTIIQSVQKTGRLLIVHEAVKRSGFGGEVASLVAESEAFYALRKPIQRLGGKAIPMPYQKELEYHAIPQLEDILAAVRHLMDR